MTILLIPAILASIVVYGVKSEVKYWKEFKR